MKKDNKFRTTNINQIVDISDMLGLPLNDFEQMSDLDVCRTWQSLYEEYTFLFDC